MKFRGLLVGTAVVASTIAMTSAATMAHAATTTSHPAATSSSQTPIAGIVPPMGAKQSSPTVQGRCSEPHCNMTYHGGFIESRPRVLLVFWGTKWERSAYNGARNYLISLFRGLGVTSRDHWSTTLSQYRGRNGHPSFGGSVLWNWYYDPARVPGNVTYGDLRGLALSLARQHHVGGTSIQVVIASQSGTCFSPAFAGNCGHYDPNGVFCGWHSATAKGSVGGISFTNLPYQIDAGYHCGEGWHGSHFAGFSTVAAHEYAESATDPYPVSSVSYGWIDLHDRSGGEVGDKCAWQNPSGYVTLTTGRFVMQSLWSNAAHGCRM